MLSGRVSFLELSLIEKLFFGQIVLSFSILCKMGNNILRSGNHFGKSGDVVYILLLISPGICAFLQKLTAGKPAIGGPWSLIDLDGNLVTNKSFEGKWTLLYFGMYWFLLLC